MLSLDSLFPLAMLGLVVCSTLYFTRSISPALLFSAGVGLQVFSGRWNQLGIPIGLDRVLMLAAATLFVLQLTPDARQRALQLARSPRSVLLIIVLLVGVASAAWCGTLFTEDGYFGLFDRYGLVPFAAFVFAPLLFPNERTRNYLLWVLVGTGTYLGVTAILEMSGHVNWAFPQYIANADLGIHWGRARGPFLETTGNGLALIMCGVAATIAFVTWTKPWHKRIAGLCLVLCVAGAFLTLTRAVWIGTIVALVVGLGAGAKSRRFLLPGLAATAAVVVLALVLVPGLGDRALARGTSEQPVWDRNNTNAAALRVIQEEPLTGIGYRNFRDSSGEYLWQADNYPLTGSNLEVHNVFLSRFAELGVLGGATWLAGMVACVGAALVAPVRPELQLWRQGFAAAAAGWFVVAAFSPASASFGNLLLWAWAGIVLSGALARTSRSSVETTIDLREPSRLGSR